MHRFVRQHRRFAWLTLLLLLVDLIARGLFFALPQTDPADVLLLQPAATIDARDFATVLFGLNLAALLFAFAAAISGAGLFVRLPNLREVLRAIGWHVLAAMLALTAIILRLAFDSALVTQDFRALLAAGIGLAFWGIAILSGRRGARLRRGGS